MEAILDDRYDEPCVDFYSLCGCPNDIAGMVLDIAHLAPSRVSGLTMSHRIVSTVEVVRIEQHLASWTWVSSAKPYVSEEAMHHDRDRYHCSSAWRSGLLLYLYRVHHWLPNDAVPMSILESAREVVDHVSASRDATIISRQALLPLFWAACELNDTSTYGEVMDLIAIWDERTRYHLFGDAASLLSDLRAKREHSRQDDIWWGTVVDARCERQSETDLRMTVTFG